MKQSILHFYLIILVYSFFGTSIYSFDLEANNYFSAGINTIWYSESYSDESQLLPGIEISFISELDSKI